MGIQSAIMKASFRSELTFNFLNFVLRIVAKRINNKLKDNVDVVEILMRNGLKTVNPCFFSDKTNIIKVRDCMRGDDISMLKVGRIDKYQIELFKLAKEIEKRLFFHVPSITKNEVDWFIMEEIKGKFLNDLYDQDPDKCVKICKKISDNYQILLDEFRKRNKIKKSLRSCERWLFSTLNLWSKPIIDAGLIDLSLVQKIESDFREIIARKGIGFFDWVHGNIIGDHIIIDPNGDFYLLDLAMNLRPGNGYYDFLRSLDFMLLKANGNLSGNIERWMKEYLSDFNEEEVKLVFAFQCIGILGWDILHHNVEYVAGNKKEKIQSFLKFIRREY